MRHYVHNVDLNTWMITSNASPTVAINTYDT